MDERTKEDSEGTPRIRPRQGESHIRWAIALGLSVAGGIWGLSWQLSGIGPAATAAATAQCAIQHEHLGKLIQQERERAERAEQQLRLEQQAADTKILDQLFVLYGKRR